MLSKSLSARVVHSSRLLVVRIKLFDLGFKVFAHRIVAVQIARIRVFYAQAHLLVKPSSVSSLGLGCIMRR